MKARIKEKWGLYKGQVQKENGNWKTVTDSCFTHAGATLALKRWKKKHDRKQPFTI